MGFLDQLNVCEASQTRDRTPIGRFRSRLAAAIGTQIELAVAESEGRSLTLTKKRWRKTGPDGEKTLTDISRSVRPWWWRDDAGLIFLALKSGANRLELAPGKTAVQVVDASALPDTLQMLRKAVVAGELDRYADTGRAVIRRIGKTKTAPAKPTGTPKGSDKT